METFLLVVILIVLLVRWIVLSGKMSRMDQRLDYLSDKHTDPELVKRVFALETVVQELRGTARPEPAPIPVVPTPIETPVIEKPAIEEPAMAPPAAAEINFCELCGRVLSEGVVCDCRSIETPPPLPAFEPEQPTSRPPLEEIPVAGFASSATPVGPSFSERVRESMKGEEWEAVVGGSLAEQARRICSGNRRRAAA